MNLKNRIWLMIQMQRLVHSKYLKLLMGMRCRYAENEIEAQAIRGQAAKLYEELIRAVTAILEETGVLLPMYDKALFSDAAYTTIMKASQNIAAVRHFMQIQRLEVWRCTFHFSDTRWINRTRRGVNLEMLVTDFDCRFECVLRDIENKARERKQRAIEMTAWACINVTVPQQRNAEARHKQWDKGGRKMEKMEGNNIPKLIQKTGGFDTMNMDSKFNLDHMVQMQDAATEQGMRYGKTHRHQYEGIMGPLWRDEGEPEEFNESLP